MSNLETRPPETAGAATAAASGPVFEELAPREVPLGGPRAMLVRRTLPHRVRRTVGAWCFLDHYGSSAQPPDAPMHVPEHPHTGLQTVTWLFDGEVRHRDSLGSDQLVHPGELNLMTAGNGIAHAEDTALSASTPARALHGLQLWVALPDGSRDAPPAFAHHADLPVVEVGGVRATVLIGTVLVGDGGGRSSSAQAFTPLLGAELVLAPGADDPLTLDPGFEHALLAVDGDVQVDGRRLEATSLAYLGTGRDELALASHRGGRAVLLGGTPLGEPLVMWWNFVGRTHEDIVAARADWESGRRFAPVPGYGERLAAPALPTTRLIAR
jgi:redox-sensitive bicupin YhaK (pirin superfamily)